MAQNRYYSSTTRRTTLTADPGTSGTTLTVADSTVFSSLDGKYPYALVISTDGTDREIVYVTARPTGTTLTVTRGRDGTAGQAHAAGSTVDHMVIAADLNELSAHMAASWINVRDYGATGDGTTNDATAIQTALDLASVTTPGATVFFPPGQYKVNSELELKGPVTLQLDKDAWIIRGSSSMQYVIKNFNSSYAPTGYGGRGGIRIYGGVIDGGATSFTTSCTAVVFAHADNIRIEDLTVANVVDWHAIEINSSRNVVVRYCTFKGFRVVTAGRHISEAVQIDLALNSAALPGIGAGAYDNTPCDGVLIEGCTVEPFGAYSGFGSLAGSHSWAAGNQHTSIRIIGNHCMNLAHYMVAAANWSNVSVEGNICEDSNGFLSIELPASMTSDLYGFTVAANVIRNSGTANSAPSVLAYAINVQGIDDGATADIGTGKYIQNVSIVGNTFQTVNNTAAMIRALNALTLTVGGNVVDCNAPWIVRITGCRGAKVAALTAYDFAGGVLLEQGTGTPSNATSIGAHLSGLVLERGTDTFVQFSTGVWGAALKSSKLMSQMAASTEMIYINGPDIVVQDTLVWKRDGSGTCNGIKVDTSAQRPYFTGVYVKGFGTNTSTAASGVTNTGVWSVSGTVTLDPAIASWTAGSINKIVSTN